MKRAAIIIRDPGQQYEGLRISVGLQLAGIEVEMFVLHHAIETMDEAYRDNMTFLDEIGGRRFTNNAENAEKHGFTHLTIVQSAARICRADMILPF